MFFHCSFQIITIRPRQLEKLAKLIWERARATRKGTKGMVDNGPRSFRLTGSGSINGHTFRRLTRVGPSQPVQPGIVAHSPTRRRDMETLGPPRGVARARRVGRVGLSVRADPGHGRGRHCVGGIDIELAQRREILDRFGVELERSSHAG